MLQITVQGDEKFDEENNLFIVSRPHVLQLEHSLVSISKWEATWKKAFLTRVPKTEEESLDYVRCMTLTQNVPTDVYNFLSRANMDEIESYIGTPMTATTFRKDEGRGTSAEIITSEIIYYWMISHTIPFECQKWHLNRLLTLINVCNLKNQPAKKVSKKDLYSRNHSLNSARRKALGSKG